MASRGGKARATPIQAPLPRTEWNFTKVPRAEWFGCMGYELLRESPSIRRLASLVLEYYRKLSAEHGHDPSEVALPTFEEFRDHQENASYLTLIAMATNGFPATPWQELKDPRFRRAIGKSLDHWRRLPKVRASAAPVHSAVQFVGIEPCNEAKELLEADGHVVEITLYRTSHDIPKSHDVLLIDPNAEDGDIMEGVRAYLALPHRAKSTSEKSEKKGRGGRPANFNLPDAVLTALGIMRLAHHLPVNDAWELSHPRKEPSRKKVGVIHSDKNIEVGRARELCREAMHEHFILPEGETPLHYRRKKAVN